MDNNDAVLWQRWTGTRDADAFAEIVFRHSNMVYATCLRMLRNPSDAEDVSQQCFFELLSARVRVRSSLAPWLYSVAFRRSLDRRKADARRRHREESYAPAASADADPARAELLALVDEAIAQLPNSQRDPIVQRFLRGKTNSEIAREMGIAESTLRYRIDKGVDRLRVIVSQRGISVTVVALTTALGSNAAQAAPASLKASATKLALGTVANASRPVSGFRALAASVTKRLVMVATTVALIGLAATWVTLQPQTPAPPETTDQPVVAKAATDVSLTQSPADTAAVTATLPVLASSATDAATSDLDIAAAPTAPVSTLPANAEYDDDQSEEEASISGYVYDDAGEPIVGSRVVAATWFSSADYPSRPAWSALTDATGHYEVAGIRRAPPYGSIPFVDVSVSAQGYETVGRRVTTLVSRTVDAVDFKLLEGVPLTARLFSADGTPVDDGIIVARWYRSASHSGNFNYIFATTDEEGYFSLGLRKSSGAVNAIVDAHGNRTIVYPAPGALSFLAKSVRHGQALFVNVPVGEAEVVDLRMKRLASLSGTITWSDGTPATDIALILECRFAKDGSEPDYESNVPSYSSPITSGYMRTAATDASGRFSFSDLAPGPDFVMIISSSEGAENGGAFLKLDTRWIGPIGAGEDRSWEHTLLRSHERLRLVGRMIGAQSGKPLRDAKVHYEQPSVGVSSFMGVHRDTGRYEIVIRDPGEVEVWPSYGARTTEELRSRYGRKVRWEDGGLERVDFSIPEPFSLSMRAIDIHGEPIPNLSIHIVGGNTSYGPLETDDEGKYTYDGFEPDAVGYFRIMGQGFISTESLPTIGETGVAYPEDTIVMFGDGGIEGIATNANGAPLANMNLYINFKAQSFTYRVGGEERDTVIRGVQTDANGAFAAVDGFPAVDGSIRVFRPAFDGNRAGSDPVPTSVVAQRIVNVGAIRLKLMP